MGLWQCKKFGTLYLRKAGKRGGARGIFQYSSLMQSSCLHRNDKPWDDMPRLEGWSASNGPQAVALPCAGCTGGYL